MAKKLSAVLMKIQRPKSTSERPASRSHANRLEEPGNVTWVSTVRSKLDTKAEMTSAQTERQTRAMPIIAATLTA